MPLTSFSSATTSALRPAPSSVRPFRQFVLPQLKRFADFCYAYGKLVVLHTDGAMRLIIPYY